MPPSPLTKLRFVLLCLPVLLSCSCIPFIGGGKDLELDLDFFAARLDPNNPLDQKMLTLSEQVRAHPEDYPSRHELAIRWFERGNCSVAEQILRELCREQPNIPDAWNDLGRSYLGLARYDKAKKAFRRAIKLKPDYAVAHYNLAFARSSNNEVNGVLQQYIRALTLDPTLLDPANNWHIPQNQWIGIFKHYQYMLMRSSYMAGTALQNLSDAHARALAAEAGTEQEPEQPQPAPPAQPEP